MTADAAKQFDEPADQGAHVGVAGVDLVDDQQRTLKSRRPHVGMRDSQPRQQRLIDGAGSDRRCEKALGLFGVPADGPVVHFPPVHFKTPDAKPFTVINPQITRHGQRHGDLFLSEG